MAELFAKFEVNNSPWWPRMARLLGGSVALHLILSACALYIPAVRNMLNIAGEFSGVQYVSEDYDRTLIGERAQIIEFPHEKFTYPPGYFMADMSPEQIAALQQQQAQIVQQYQAPPPPPVIPRFRAPRPIVIPRPQPSPTPAASPTPQPSPATANAGKGTNNPEEKLSPEQEKKLDQIAAQTGIKRPKQLINKKPFTDWLANASQMKNKGEIDLSGTIEMTVEAEGIDDQGKLVQPEITQKSGDPKLQSLANDLIAALSDSGVLDFLGGTGHVVFTLKLDQDNVDVNVTTEMENENEASKKANGYNALLTVAGIAREGRDEAVIYKNTKATADGKKIVLSFSLPRQTAGDMLKKQLPPTS